MLCDVHLIVASTRPPRPSILPSEFDKAGPALLIIELAEDVTFDNPSEALDVAPAAFSFALTAVEEAALATSDVVEAPRTGVLVKGTRKDRNAGRAAIGVILETAASPTQTRIRIVRTFAKRGVCRSCRGSF